MLEMWWLVRSEIIALLQIFWRCVSKEFVVDSLLSVCDGLRCSSKNSEQSSIRSIKDGVSLIFAGHLKISGQFCSLIFDI